MKRVGRILLAACISFPISALADICPDKEPPTEQFSQDHSCPAATIHEEGELYTDASWDCFSLVPTKSVAVSYSAGKHKGSLPSVGSLLPAAEKDFKDRTWEVSKVQCSGKSKVMVEYFGGGNCSRCLRSVEYTFSRDGKLESAKLK